jgi:hypothetical protein
MAQDGKTQREAAERVPGPVAAAEPTGPPKLPLPTRDTADAPPPMPPALSGGGLGALKPGGKTGGGNSKSGGDQAGRRPAKRRPAGPARTQIAANDDVPSIGGLIFALQQQPSSRPFQLAAAASGGWLAVGALLVWAMVASHVSPTGSSFFASPMMVVAAATISLPIALFWFLALLVWRAQELKLMSSAMTEVAVRLAEPDRAAEQSAASLGQAVRRQVSFMNEAISRALGRAGELEALVHNEVAALEKSYNENEHKIKGLIQELAGERHALVSTTDKVSETLKAMGGEVPQLIENLSQQQIKLAKIIEGAGQNLIALENQLSTASGSLETALANRTQQLQAVLDDYTVALDATLASRAEALDVQLVQRTRALDAAFSERLALVDDSMQRSAMAIDAAFSQKAGALTSAVENHVRSLSDTLVRQAHNMDDSLLRSTLAIDTVVNEKAKLLSAAVESHVRSLSDTLGRQANNFDASMLQGIDAVRRTSDNVTRQSLKAIEGLSGQADLLKNVSENLLQQVSNVTNKFDSQGRFIVDAASALETANSRIDTTLQKRHGELNDTLQRLSGKADQLDQVMRGYSQTVEGTLADAEARARHLIQQLAQGTLTHAQAASAEVERLRSQTDAHSKAVVQAFERMRMHTDAQSQAVVAEVERLREQTDAQTMRAIEDMRAKVSGVSQEVSQHLGSLTTRFNETSDDLRSQAARSAAALQAEHERLRSEAQRLPAATRESTETMRAALNDQLLAFSETSNELRSQAARSAATLHAEQERVRAEAERLPVATRESADAMRVALNEQLRALEQLSSLSARERRDVSPPGPLPSAAAPPSLTQGYGVPPGAPPPPPPLQADNGGERWSLGDLLARASRDDDGVARAPVALDLQGIAGALDPTTASAIWSRFRAGQRGIMVRSIYTTEGRASFDEVSERYGRDPDFRRTVDRFLSDFERLVRDIEQQSPRAVHGHLVSDAGRVYLFLAHASGRLR